MSEGASPKRGDIFWVDFNPGRGSEQRGLRPALVISNDVGNANAPTVIVVVLTTADYRKPYPFLVAIAAGEGGCAKAGFVNCSQLLTVSKDRIGARLGSLNSDKMGEVDAALRYAIGL